MGAGMKHEGNSMSLWPNELQSEKGSGNEAGCLRKHRQCGQLRYSAL